MDGAHTTARKRTAHKRTAHKRTDGAQTGGSQTDAARTQTGRAVRRLPHRRAKPRAAEPSQPSQSSVPSQPSHWSAMPCRASRGASPRQGIIGAGRIIDDWSCWHAARAHVAACEGFPTAAHLPCRADHLQPVVSHRKVEDEGDAPAIQPIPRRGRAIRTVDAAICSAEKSTLLSSTRRSEG